MSLLGAKVTELFFWLKPIPRDKCGDILNIYITLASTLLVHLCHIVKFKNYNS